MRDTFENWEALQECAVVFLTIEWQISSMPFDVLNYHIEPEHKSGCEVASAQ